MLKTHEETMNVQVSVPPPGRWLWNDESQTLEFVSSTPAEETVLKKRRQTNVNFHCLQQRSEWLAEVLTLNHRGRQSNLKSLSPARLDEYRSSVMQRQGEHVSIHDVKQVAVGLLQENYLLPIPVCFMAVLKSKPLDDVLTSLLLYLSCYFEYKILENQPQPLMVVDSVTEQQMMEATLVKLEMARKKLAVCYFSLIMDLNMNQHRLTDHHRGQISSNSREWRLHACLYSFFCYVAWVTFGRKDLKVIQEELGRLLYSDSFNTAVRNMADGDSATTSTADDATAKTTTAAAADPEETGRDRALKQRSFQRRASMSSLVNQRSPLMVSLLPSPREQSPHLFLSSSAWRNSPMQSPLQAGYRHTKALTEELTQRLATASFGILGKPLNQFSRSTLLPYGKQQNNRGEDGEVENPGNNNSGDHPGIHVGGSKSSFMTPKMTDIVRYGSSTHTKS